MSQKHGVKKLEDGTYGIIYEVRDPFKAFHSSGKRWSVLCCHRRAGKTVACLHHLIRDSLNNQKHVYAYIAPTYTQAKRVAWQYIRDFIGGLPGMKFNEAELKVTFPTGSVLYLLGAERPDSLRGLALNGAVFDEYSQQPPNIFGEIIYPALTDKQGYAIWIGTVIGKNHLWKLWDEHKNDPEWFTMYLKASESGILPDEELEIAKTKMSKEQYEQEFELNTNAAVRGAYYASYIAEIRERGQIKPLAYEKSIPVSTWWDLGVNDPTSIIFAQYSQGEWRIIDHEEHSDQGLEFYAKLIQNKGYIYDTHWLPHDAEVKSLATGKKRIDTLKELLPGAKIKTVPMTRIEDGINAVRMILDKCWFDAEKCEYLLECLSLYRQDWDEKKGMYKDRPLHDYTSHSSDAMRYFAVSAKKPHAPEGPVFEYKSTYTI